MKSNKIFSLLLLGAVAFGSCNSEDEPLTNPLSGENQVKFQASIGASVTTRAAGTTWNAGDAIGVYALNAGQKLPDGVYDSKSNIKYTTPTEAEQGVFTAATEGITFPETGNLDFIAYYPYRESLANNVYAIDVADQSKPAAIDLLFSNNAVNQSEPAVALQFKHQLAMLVLNVSAGDGVTSLDGLTVSIEGLKTDGTFNLADGSITTGTTVKTITPVVAASGKTATVAAILVPGQDLKDTKISFKVGGQTYEWTPDAQAVETGKKYTYPSIQLSTTGVTVVQPSATIVDWVDVEIGGIVTLKPNEGEQGSWTVAELRSKFTGTEYTITEEVKVKAVVIQNKEGGNSTSLKNIVIQDETAGIAVRFVENNETLTFGDEVEISLKDQKLSAYNGLLQINNLPNANVTKTGTKTVTAKEVTAADFLAGKYESQYVAVPNVQVVAADLEKTFATDKHGSINMEFENGGQFILFTSSYAVFKNQKVPQGSGTLKGIASINQPKDGEAVYQILPTVAADVEGLTQSRFGSSTSTLEVSPATIQLEASAADAQSITLTASGAWTTTTEGSGFTVSPESGTGNATVTVTATAASGASGKIIFALTGTALTKEVTISQKGDSPTPTSNNLFPGSDFEDWTAFTGGLKPNLGLKDYAVQVDGGRNNSKALTIKGTPGANDYVFTATVPEGFSAEGKTKVVFYIKGTGGKSLSLNLYSDEISGKYQAYIPFNLGDCVTDKELSKSSSNQYGGAINTENDWVKITLNIPEDFNIAVKGGNDLFGFKVGKDAAYDLLVDDITLE